MNTVTSHRVLDTAQMEAITGYDQRTLRERMCNGALGDGLREGRHFTRVPGGRKILFDWTAIAADMGLPDDGQQPGDLLVTDEMAKVIHYDSRTLRETLVGKLFQRGKHYFHLPAERARTLLFLKSAVLAAVGISSAAVSFAQVPTAQPNDPQGEPHLAAGDVEADQARPPESGGPEVPRSAFTPSATDFWAQAAQAYLDDLPAHIRATARAELTTAVERDLAPYFASRTVSEITLPDVTIALENITAERGRHFAVICFHVLRGIFEHATRLWGVPSPIKHLERIPPSEKLPRVLRIHDAVRLIARAPELFRPYFIVRLFTGISNEEAHSLRGRSILLDTEEIRIDEVRVGSMWVPLDETKTRTIKMSRIVKEALIQQRTASLKSNEDDLVFADAQGRALKTPWVTAKVFEPLLDAAGIRRMQLRELCHTAPFLWLCANHPAHEVAEWCGYGSDATALLNIYRRLTFSGDGYSNVDRLLAAGTTDEARQQLLMPLALPLAGQAGA